MKRSWIFAFLLVAAVLGAAPATVQVKEASVYSKASPTSTFLGKLKAGTVLTVLQEKDGWAQVRAQGLTGWLRSQAYTTKALDLKSTTATGASVSATEVSLAGRGFSAQVESDYRSKNPALDFATLDALEAGGVDADRLLAFLRDGGLRPREAR